MKLLEETVRELKGEDIADDVRATVNLKVDFKIDESYVADMNQRLMLYRKVAAARRDEEIDQVLEEAVDRYGPLPTALLNLADYGRIRILADQLGVDTIDREGRTVVIKFRPQTKVDPVRLVALVKRRPELTLVPPSGLRLTMGGPVSGPVSGPPGGTPPARVQAGTPVKPQNLGRMPGQVPKGSKSSKAPVAPPSWWTARARAGAVTPGFTKDEILKAAKDDPRAPGGVFESLGDVLSELLDGR